MLTIAKSKKCILQLQQQVVTGEGGGWEGAFPERLVRSQKEKRGRVCLPPQ